MIFMRATIVAPSLLTILSIGFFYLLNRAKTPSVESDIRYSRLYAPHLSTSVSCHLNDAFGSSCANRIDCRTCRFRNLCYRPDLDEYLFFWGGDTIVSGLSLNDESPVTGMSSVDGLNVHQLILTELPSDAASKLDIRMLYDDDDDDYGHSVAGYTMPVVLLMKRFKPDNLMHVLHDDLLPMFATLLSEVCALCSGSDMERCINSRVRLVMLDGHSEHDYFSLYSLLSGAGKPILSKDLAKDGATYCFSSAIVGLSRETVWYQYGYGRPQGTSGRKIHEPILRRFVAFILRQLDVNHQTCAATSSGRRAPYAVVVLRRTNRLILNEMNLIEAISSTTGFRVIILDPAETEIFEALKLVACADLLVGMHGATLALSLFLKRGSSILELFPYNVPAKDYTPYRTLAGISAMKLNYASWENKIQDNTITHPDWPPELGGIAHLDDGARSTIEYSDTPVPQYHCCSHPEWLFRIYQDTIVDIPSFVDVLERLIPSTSSSATSMDELSNFAINPGPVLNLKCEKKLTNSENENDPMIEYRLIWDSPWNLRFSSPPLTRCEAAAIWIERVGVSQDVESILTAHTFHVFQAATVHERYNCWVACKVANRTGIMKWVECR